MNELSIDSLVLKLDEKTVLSEKDEWTVFQENERMKIWKNKYGDFLKIMFIPFPPDYPETISDLTGLRNLYRDIITKEHGAIIEVDKEFYGDILLVKTLFKIPQDPTGFTYLGSFTLPMKDFCFVITAECHELGMTGVRECAIMLISEKIGSIPKGTLDGWSADPYDPNFNNCVLRNIADDEKYDKDFPNHPLTRTRKILSAIKDTMLLKEEIAVSEPFFETLE